MPSLETAVAAVLFGGLTIYVLSGGADFGGGVWDLLARGPRRQAQRDLIARAIAPIWEANHVWLIFVIVLLFTGFPRAFAALSIALHVPLALLLLGIVMRGSAFVFRTYDVHPGRRVRHWAVLFAGASIVTPVMLGVIVGAVTSGTIRVDVPTGRVLSGYLDSWLGLYPLAVGLFALALFAFLAAVYLTLETDDPALRDDFRARALAAQGAVAGLAALSYALAAQGAPLIRFALQEAWWGRPLQGLAAALALGAAWGLLRRRFALARGLAIAEAAVILWGWGLAQYPYLVAPHLTVSNAAAPPAVLAPLLVVVGLGAAVLFPSLAYLYHVFKARRV
jgi:cytochrome d ubiquinol oxidase subunit II